MILSFRLRRPPSPLIFIPDAPKGGQFTISLSAESRYAKLPAARDRSVEVPLYVDRVVERREKTGPPVTFE